MTDEDLMTDEANEAKEMARIIIAHHFGSRPGRIKYKASGLSNFVFSAKHSEGDFIVRISFEPARINDFIKEQWAQTQARAAGVPTSDILEVGNEVVPHPFMILRFVAGREATGHPERMKILREMGRFAALINSIPTNGFGSTFDWSSNQLSHNETFDEYLQKELQIESRLQTLEKRRALAAGQIKSIRAIFAEAVKSNPQPALNHGDIRLKNVIADEQGEIKAILDWEDCTSNLAPQWELSLVLHDLSIDEKQVFLEGYGISEKKLRKFRP